MAVAFRARLGQARTAMKYQGFNASAPGGWLFAMVLAAALFTATFGLGGAVMARAETAAGVKTFHGRYIIGCDGGRSQVRKSMNVDFEGFQFPERFLVLTTPYDFARHGYALTNYIADPDEWCALFKVRGPDDNGIWRVLFPTRAEETEDEIFADATIEARLQGFNPKPRPYDIAHRNLYEVHQRVATNYRDKRLLIAGDAAHINNPLGGMGMNFGFHDAFNLTEKLRDIWSGADEDLLDLYDRQRRTVAAEYLQRQTIENKKISSSGIRRRAKNSTTNSAASSPRKADNAST
ncbi:MAG: FAD-dependent monooxygenase, partial [Proteobacteria bacterium]|nr:FAD-dependent monooxygenase [Pseudomonadota bacterium]